MKIIACIDKDNGIGKNGDLLVHLHADMEHFKELTSGNVVVMGKNTYLSLPRRPLKNRINIVLSKTFQTDDAIVVRSIDELFSFLSKHKINTDSVYVCGGANVYKELMPYCDTMEITKVQREFDADTFFPKVDLSAWSRYYRSVGYENGVGYSFMVFHRKGKK